MPCGKQGVASAVELANSAGSSAPQIINAAQQSFVDGWQQAMWAGAAVMGALFVYIALRGPEKTTAADEAEATEAIAAG